MRTAVLIIAGLFAWIVGVFVLSSMGRWLSGRGPEEPPDERR